MSIFYAYGMSIKFRRICKNLLSLAILARMITRAQCRAARALLEWNQQDLARQASVGIVTVHQFESGVSQPRRATLDVIRRAFESAGVEFIDENGVRLRKRHQKKG
jgi:DNA-binding XRE family transcriptional regulator